MDELDENDKLTVTRARKLQKFLSQPFCVAENFTGLQGKYVPLAETVKGFAAIVDGRSMTCPSGRSSTWARWTMPARRQQAAEEKGGALMEKFILNITAPAASSIRATAKA